MKGKFTHTEIMDELKAKQAQEIVPVIMDLLNPTSVVDVGCGTASLLKVFKNKGAKVIGIDGSWVNKDMLFENIEENEFIERNLEESLLSLNIRADITICLEVAEHLSEKRASSLVKDLVIMSDIILFSAAIPGQGGQNHINEQWLPYWEEKFNSHGFVCHDILKNIFWEKENVLWWYRQNMVLFAKKNITISDDNLKYNHLKKLIHPQLFKTIVDYKEKNAIKRHTKILMKAILHKVGLLQ